MFRLLVVALTLTAAVVAQAGTYRVPSQYPSIQAGIDAASGGDTVLVAPGLYTGEGNIDVSFRGKGIALKSEAGPAETIIDCEGQGWAFVLRDQVNEDPLIYGFTIRNGNGGRQGGAIECFGFSPTIRYCVFANNQAEYGGALYFNGSSVQGLLANCTFVSNAASRAGEVYYSEYSADATFERCLIFENTSANGPIVAPSYYRPWTPSNGGTITLVCCDVFGNNPRDWTGKLADQFSTNDNFWTDPVFCDPDNELFGIHEGSPLRPEASPCNQLVGALGVNCSDCRDIDEDGLCLIDDNCPFHYNPDQSDGDEDGHGDVCESYYEDYDGDGTADEFDNCPVNYNPDQEDVNVDGTGEACCCTGVHVGDANGSGADEPTISDISVIIDALFISANWSVIPCRAEADVNHSGGCNPGREDITISDIAWIIEYLFIGCGERTMPRCLDDCP